MRRFFLTALALGSLLAALAGAAPGLAGAQTASPAAGGERDANAALVIRYYELFNQGDFDAFADVLASDFVIHTAAPGDDSGIEGLIAVVSEARAGLPDIAITLDDLFVEGDLVVARTTIRGTHLGDFFGAPPTGQIIETEAIDLWQVTDGRLAANWHLEDILGVVQQIAMGGDGEAATPDATMAETADTASPPEIEAATEANKALAERFYADIFVEGDLAAADEILAPEFVWHNEVPPGPAGVQTFAEEMRTAFPDLQLTPEQIVAEDDRVAILWTLSGTHEGDFFGVPATGRRVTIPGIDIYRIAGDRIAEIWTVGDDLGLLAQLGAFPGGGDDAATPSP